MSHLRRAVPSAAFYEDALRQLWRTPPGTAASFPTSSRSTSWPKSATAANPGPSPPGSPTASPRSRGSPGSGSSRWRAASSAWRSLSSANEEPPGPHPDDRPQAQRKGRIPLRHRFGLRRFPDRQPASGRGAGPRPDRQLHGRRAWGRPTAAVRFSVLDKVELGAVAFRNVPVMVSDIHPFRGLKKGLLGTALLKRFNVTIDVEAEAHGPLPARPARASRRQHRPDGRGGGRPALPLRRDDRRGLPGRGAPGPLHPGLGGGHEPRGRRRSSRSTSSRSSTRPGSSAAASRAPRGRNRSTGSTD